MPDTLSKLGCEGMWDDFRAALERVLLNYEERVMLVISDQERESLLVQFFGLDEGRGQD